MEHKVKLFFKIWLFFLLVSINSFCQQDNTQAELTLQEVIQIAKDQSPDALLAKHRFREQYWDYRTYKASFLPEVSLHSNLVDFNNSIRRTTYLGQDAFVESNSNTSSLSLDVNQAITFTGGEIFINSDIARLDNFMDTSVTYTTTPFNIGFRQPLDGFNPYKWKKKIEPLEYQEAKQEYLQSMEQVARRAINLFFNTATAQINLAIAKQNYSNADTLYTIAEGRYEIGTIAENDVLQMELQLLNARNDLQNAHTNLQSAKNQLQSFLGYQKSVDFKLQLPKTIPDVSIDYQKAQSLAKENNPDYLQYKRRIFEGEQNVARTKSEKGLNADLFLTYGLNKSTPEFDEAYKDPLYRSRIRAGIEIPILDWGLSEGKYKMAKSRLEVIKTQVKQSKTDFRRNLFLTVRKFNLQDDQVEVAARADTIAQRRYEVAKQRFLVGKIDVLKLNEARKDKDISKNTYISAIKQYWSMYYDLRQITLYDFKNEQELDVNFLDIAEGNN